MATYNTKAYNDALEGKDGTPDKTVAADPQNLGGQVYAATGFYDGDLASGDDINLFKLPENAYIIAVALYTTGTTTNSLTFDLGDAGDDNRYLSGISKTATGGAMYMPLVYRRCGANRVIKMKWEGANPASDWTYLVTCFYTLGR